MRWVRRGLQGISVAGLLLAAACARTTLPALTSDTAPLAIETDERDLWRESDQIEQRLDKSGFLYNDARVSALLTSVADRLVGGQPLVSGLSLRVKVIRDPSLNAFALPNGALYVHTGILARLENESQVATLLGHEIAHVTHRHALRERRSAQNVGAWVAALQTLLGTVALASGNAPLASQMAKMTGDAGALWVLAAVRGYSRDLEAEADREGFGALVRVGYDTSQAVRVFEILLEDVEAKHVEEPFFFSTHPKLEQRIESYRQLQSSTAPTAVAAYTDAPAYADLAATLILDNAQLDLDAGRAPDARACLERYVMRNPTSPHAYFLLGEAYRRSGRGELFAEEARAAYEQAAQLDPGYGDPHRELGLLLRAAHRMQPAHREFERYLALSPSAVDAPIVRGYLSEISGP